MSILKARLQSAHRNAFDLLTLRSAVLASPVFLRAQIFVSLMEKAPDLSRSLADSEQRRLISNTVEQMIVECWVKCSSTGVAVGDG